jgi:hypothetical protein
MLLIRRLAGRVIMMGGRHGYHNRYKKRKREERYFGTIISSACFRVNPDKRSGHEDDDKEDDRNKDPEDAGFPPSKGTTGSFNTIF